MNTIYTTGTVDPEALALLIKERDELRAALQERDAELEQKSKHLFEALTEAEVLQAKIAKANDRLEKMGGLALRVDETNVRLKAELTRIKGQAAVGMKAENTALGNPIVWWSDVPVGSSLFLEAGAQAHFEEQPDGSVIPVDPSEMQTGAQPVQQEPVATLHDDGYWTWKGTPPHASSFAGWRMDVYAAPMQASSCVSKTAESDAQSDLTINPHGALAKAVENLRRAVRTAWMTGVEDWRRLYDPELLALLGCKHFQDLYEAAHGIGEQS